jgi:hypothetical protein
MEGRLGAFIHEYTGYDSVLLCNFTGVWEEQIKGGYTLITLPRNQLLIRYAVTSPVYTVTIRCYYTP